MNQFFNSLPKPVLAVGVILLGFLLIMINDPPRTVCDQQMELFRDAQKSFLYGVNAAGLVATGAAVKELYELCQANNGPGACFEFFHRLKTFEVDLSNIPDRCSDSAASEVEIATWLWKTLRLMVEIAWGENLPVASAHKHSWLDSSDVALYCRLKENAIRIYGTAAFSEWRDRVLRDLPGANKMSSDARWRRSIFSTSCQAYR